jgi:hypothetical protein
VYPRSLAPSRADIRFFVRMITMSAARRVAHGLRSPGSIIATAGGLSVLLLARRRPVAALGHDSDWVIFAVAGLLIGLGVRAWWRHLAGRLADSTWVVLGGHPGALGLGLLATQAGLAAVLLAGTVRTVKSASQISLTVAWWSAAMVAWLCICVVIGALLLRANRRPGWWSTRGIAMVGACAGGAASLMTLLAAGETNPRALAAGGLALVTVGAGGLLPRFLMHERVRLGVDGDPVEAFSRPSRETQTSAPARARFAGVKRIAARLVVRTLFAEIVQVLALAAFVGIVTAGVRNLEGPTRAALMAAGLLAVVTVGLAARLRRSVGQQHLFLFLHRPAPGSRVWRELAQGECAVFAIVIGAVYLLVTLPSAAWRQDDAVWLLLAVTMEWAAYVFLAAHVLSPGSRGDDSLRSLLVAAGAAVSLAIVLIKAVAIGNLLGRWFVPVQSVVSCLAVISWAARAPYYVNGPRRVFGLPSTTVRRNP